MRKKKCHLYLITPPKLEVSRAYDQLRCAFDGGPIAALQVRLKNTYDDDICRVVDTLLPITKSYGSTLILNDRPDLAAKMGCDGVHIGHEDASYEEARMYVGANRIIGVTCNDSSHTAMEVSEKGANYVAFGAFFQTTTKQTKFHPNIDIIKIWCETTVIPCVAIGGITPENCAPLVEAGADFVAVSSVVWNHPRGANKTVTAFNKVFNNYYQPNINSV